jgi:hypothetical protein
MRSWTPDFTSSLLLLVIVAALGWYGGAILFAAGLAGSALYINFQRQAFRQMEMARLQQENLTHTLLSSASPEELAKLKNLGEVADESLFDFLKNLVAQYGGESVRGTGRLPSEEQTEAVAPGIQITLAHDLGWWYAKLQMHGETGRQFLHGEYTQWKGRGRTPEEAIEAVIKRCGASRQKRMIQDYAAKLVGDDT